MNPFQMTFRARFWAEIGADFRAKHPDKFLPMTTRNLGSGISIDSRLELSGRVYACEISLLNYTGPGVI